MEMPITYFHVSPTEVRSSETIGKSPAFKEIETLVTYLFPHIDDKDSYPNFTCVVIIIIIAWLLLCDPGIKHHIFSIRCHG